MYLFAQAHIKGELLKALSEEQEKTVIRKVRLPNAGQACYRSVLFLQIIDIFTF